VGPRPGASGGVVSDGDVDWVLTERCWTEQRSREVRILILF
jgi:hypothetical protein